ncbi:MAG: DUF3570 domain-containing protein [Methylococcaceae bacterium]|nr:DUF3570 domain-containing protein [Methylococcaceae bacterium]
MKKNEKSNKLTQLTCAALALPGLVQTASAGRVEETYNADFQYGHYSESNQRMDIDIFEGAISVPIGKSMTATVNMVKDVIGGASPIYNQRDPVTGKIYQVLSAASATSDSKCGDTICEQRDSISGGLTKFFDKGSLSLGGGYSREHDYASKFFNTAASLDFNKKLTTLNFSASLAFDDIHPSDSAYTIYDENNFKAHKTSQQYLLGVSQVIDKDSLILSNITFGYHSGFLTDPYKQVTFYGSQEISGIPFPLPLPENGLSIQEKRPRERFEWAWLTQYVRHFEQFNHAALHTDYRFSTNDWGVNAHTVEFSWHQPVADGWQVIPRFRYYSQDQADFYQPVFDGTVIFDPVSESSIAKNMGAYSSDYRLAGFGTVSGGIKLSKEFTDLKPLAHLKFQTGFEYYAHKSEFQLGGTNHDGNFADFGYYLLTASVNLKY